MSNCYRSLGDHEQDHFWRQRYFSQQNQNDESTFWEAWEHLLDGDAVAAHAVIATISSESNFYPSTRYLVFRLSEDPATRQAAVEQYEKAVPVLLDSTQPISDRVGFLIHTEMLWRLGETEKAQSQARRVIASLPGQPQARWQLIDQVVAAYSLAGETPQALQELRAYVEKNGAINYRSNRIPPWQSMTREFLQHEPDFGELVVIMDERLAAQRANVERMEAAGELAPIPPLPDSM